MAQPLTRREREVLLLRADGLKLVEVGDQLGIHRDTVHAHSASAFKKLGASNIAEAIAVAYHSGVFQPARRRLVQINRAQAMGIFKLSQQLPINHEVEFLDQGNNGEVYVRAGNDRYELPRRGGYRLLAPKDA